MQSLFSVGQETYQFGLTKTVLSGGGQGIDMDGDLNINFYLQLAED